MLRHLELPRAAMAAALLLAAGCAREGEEEVQAGPAPDTVEARMQDKEYLKDIEALRGDFREAMKRVASARDALEAAKASGEPAERIAQLSNEVARAEAYVLRNRRASANLVRSRVNRGNGGKNVHGQQLKGHQNKETTK